MCALPRATGCAPQPTLSMTLSHTSHDMAHVLRARESRPAGMPGAGGDTDQKKTKRRVSQSTHVSHHAQRGPVHTTESPELRHDESACAAARGLPRGAFCT